MKILIVDNYDSFTFNLYQLAAEVFETPPVVMRNDQSFESVLAGDFDAAIISPGPGTPRRRSDIGISEDVLTRLNIPVLGVCLGHQAICHLAGGIVTHAPEPMHGREFSVFHDGQDLFEGIPNPFTIVRYHSLIAEEPLPGCLRKSAWTADGLVMGISHTSRPIWGVQFHPESICSTFGKQIIQNFYRKTREFNKAAGRNISFPTRLLPDQESPEQRSHLRSRTAQVTEKRMFVKRCNLDLSAEEVFERAFRDKSYAFWLDSSLARESDGRFSFLGGYDSSEVDCVRYYAHTRRLSIRRGDVEELSTDDLFPYLKKRIASTQTSGPELPFDFEGGFVGYFGYELKAICGGQAAHRSSNPDCLAMLATQFVVIDHLTTAMYLVYIGTEDEQDSAERWSAELLNKLSNPAPSTINAPSEPDTMHFVPAHSRAAYLSKIDSCQHAIRDGETYEVCLTNQLTAKTSINPFEYYKVLRRRNPAPYASFLKFPELSIASSSPERFLKVDRSGTVETKPIKGTVRRDIDKQADEDLRRALANDEKARSENLMIVDLLRNDLGRVCSIGSVHVPKLMNVETYATVHQLVTTVRGKLSADHTAVDCLRAAFPGGSMTGAPKIRTLGLIDQLEGGARGVYSGSIGFLSFNGRMDLNIVIRTAVFSKNTVTIGVGGAIIALSDPEEEWAETLLKAQALLSAFEALNQDVRLVEDPLVSHGTTVGLSKRVG